MHITREELLKVSVPSETKTYVPVSHESMINLVKEELDKRAIKIKEEHYSANRGGQQMFGQFTIEGGNNEQDYSLGFRNSYDKTMQLGFVAGSRVIVCSNMMFSGDFKAAHMHNASIKNELEKIVIQTVDSLEVNFKKIQEDSQKLKTVKVDRYKIAEVLGDLFLNEEIITTTQLQIIKGELKLQENFKDETMWDIYNHTTEALKKSPVTRLIDDHVRAHEYYMAK
jgi:hypothetical protein